MPGALTDFRHQSGRWLLICVGTSICAAQAMLTIAETKAVAK